VTIVAWILVAWILVTAGHLFSVFSFSFSLRSYIFTGLDVGADDLVTDEDPGCV